MFSVLTTKEPLFLPFFILQVFQLLQNSPNHLALRRKICTLLFWLQVSFWLFFNYFSFLVVTSCLW